MSYQEIIKLLKSHKIFKSETLRCHALLLAIASLALVFAVPTHAGNLKLFIAPAAMSVVSTETLNQRSPSSVESIADLGIALELGNSRNAFVIDYYSITSTYKYTTNRRDTRDGERKDFDFEDELITTGLLIGYRRHNKKGFYIGGGAMLINPSVSRDAEISAGQGADAGEPRFFDFDFAQVTAPALTLGHDYTFKSGLVLGSHIMTSIPVTAKDKNSSAELRGLYMASLSFGIGFDW